MKWKEGVKISSLKSFDLNCLGLDHYSLLTLRDSEMILPELIKNLELYKFLEREELVAKLNNSGYFEETIFCLNNLKDSEDFKEVNELFSVIVQRANSQTVEVFYDMFASIDTERIMLALASYTILWRPITPCNYIELCKNMQGFLELTAEEILFKRILTEAINTGVSDVHLTVKHVNTIPKYTLEFREGYDLVEKDLFIFSEGTHKALIRYIISKKTKSVVGDLDTDEGVSASCNDVFGDGSVQLRIAANRTFNSYHCVIRIQLVRTTSKHIKDLGFLEAHQKDLYRLSRKVSGLTLITGPKKVGKNTTAFALANEISQRPVKIMDFSSPIELLMPFTQIDYSDKIEYLLKAIKLSKKQDLDVAFINEVPSSDVALAVRDLVNSSIHVITTFHIDRVWHLPHKLFEFYGSSFKDVLTQINGVVNQKMFVKQCTNCRQEITTAGLDDVFKEYLEKHGIKTLYDNDGCEFCNEGNLLNGLQPYVEVLILTDDIKSDLLKLSAPYEMELYIKNFMISNKKSLEFSLANAIQRGEIHYRGLYNIL